MLLQYASDRRIMRIAMIVHRFLRELNTNN